MNHAPKFWNKGYSLMSILLIPFSWIYSGLTKLRLYLGAHQKIDIPVICVGNINMGGTGKWNL